MAQDFTVYVYDKINCDREITQLGAIPASFKDICELPAIIPVVPISKFENVVKKISKYVKPGTLVIDVCSVKEFPVKAMKKLLPKKVSILGTHPMFGPDSAADTLYGTKIVLCDVRMEDTQFEKIKLYLQRHGIKTIECSPKEHDKDISHSLLLTHFIGRSLMGVGAHELKIDTKGYRRLMKILQTVENDSWELFEDMNKYNKYAKKTRQEFIKSIDRIDKKVKKL